MHNPNSTRGRTRARAWAEALGQTTGFVYRALAKLAHLINRTWGHYRFGALVSNRGYGCIVHHTLELKVPENLTVGDRVVIGKRVSIGCYAPVTIENDVHISPDVAIETAGLDFRVLTRPHTGKPIVICETAWIGGRALILGGVTIGRGAVVAAGSVVTRDVGDYEVVAGSPARVVSCRK